MNTEQAMMLLHKVLEDYCENNIRSDKEARKELDQAWNKLNLELRRSGVRESFGKSETFRM